jgi:hypothetical protein
MPAKEELTSLMLSHLKIILGDAMSNTHLIQGDQITIQKLQKPRYVFKAVFSDLLTSPG